MNAVKPLNGVRCNVKQTVRVLRERNDKTTQAPLPGPMRTSILYTETTQKYGFKCTAVLERDNRETIGEKQFSKRFQ